jgi:hypothetical protein
MSIKFPLISSRDAKPRKISNDISHQFRNEKSKERRVSMCFLPMPRRVLDSKIRHYHDVIQRTLRAAEDSIVVNIIHIAVSLRQPNPDDYWRWRFRSSSDGLVLRPSFPTTLPPWLDLKAPFNAKTIRRIILRLFSFYRLFVLTRSVIGILSTRSIIYQLNVDTTSFGILSFIRELWHFYYFIPPSSWITPRSTISEKKNWSGS